MIIANPIYDSVFKYLLDDNEAAKILISNILDIHINSLHLEPTETSVPVGSHDFSVFRIDFKATISLADNEQQVVLIELQKVKLESDIIRFRKYLGFQYMDSKISYPNDPTKGIPLYTIYFLGHTLKYALHSPIINVTRDCIDIYTKEKLPHKEEFIECLTHSSTIIQIPLFKTYRRNKLEKLMSIFEASTRHEINVVEENDQEYQLITRRLVAANSDTKVRQQMDVEDEIILELANKDLALAESQKREEVANNQKEEERKLKEEANSLVASLQAKQRNTILRLRSKGFSEAEIAEDLGISLEEIEVILK